jgi:hypothetical protein
MGRANSRLQRRLTPCTTRALRHSASPGPLLRVRAGPSQALATRVVHASGPSPQSTGGDPSDWAWGDKACTPSRPPPLCTEFVTPRPILYPYAKWEKTELWNSYALNGRKQSSGIHMHL